MKKIVLGFFLLFFWFNNSDAQCGGVLTVTTSPPPPLCYFDTVYFKVSMTGGSVGWNINVYRDSIGLSTKSDTFNTIKLVVLSGFTPFKLYATADSAGCSQKIDSIYVTAYPTPPTPLINLSHDTLFCTPSYSYYQWYFLGNPIPGATDSFYVVMSSGWYAIYATDSNGCRIYNSTSSIFISVNELSNPSSIKFSPNPLNSSSTLELNISLKNAQVIIYDMLGKEMMRKYFSGNKMEIEKGNLESGVYFVRLRAEEKEFVQKLIVE